jgi:aminopeptidase-like protein
LENGRDMKAISQSAGERMHGFIRELYPICRSITGAGLRESLRKIAVRIPIRLIEIPSGSPVLDWVVPQEWNIRHASIERLNGDVLVDFTESNLHVVGYSRPIDAVVSRDELAAHVHTLPNQPTLVPYRTGYYAEDWGFCLAHDVWEAMRDECYRVRIDSSLTDGALTYGELLLKGSDADEVLISVHCCHPSLANDNLSGMAVATELAAHLLAHSNRLTYRFLFIPATIGSVAWLACNGAVIPRIAHGLVLSCVGDSGPFHYKRSRREGAVIDRAAARVLQEQDRPFEIMPFSPYGYDERQYCSPAFDLPVGCFMRSPNGTFPEYHTSADNLDFITPDALAETLDILIELVDLLEQNVIYARVDGRGEPQLGRRGLYRAISGQKDHAATQMAVLWVLNLADGRHSLLDMAERSGLPFRELATAAGLALEAGLIRRGGAA